MANSWKSFDFFEVTQVKPGDDETRLFLESNEISSVCSGSDSLFLGGFDGYVRILGPSWKVMRNFPAHDVGSITHIRQVEGTSLLVTVAEDLSAEPVLKVWALDKPVKKTGLPTCLSTLQISNGLKPFPISAFTATENLSQIAVGFANGTVTLIRGDLINDTGTRQRTVYDSKEPVTGVQLYVDEGFTTTLFVATTARVLKLPVLANGKAMVAKTAEDAGCAVGCMTVDRRSGDVVVARDDAIYYYSIDGRGPPRAYDTPKNLIDVYGEYIAVVSPSGSGGSAGGRGREPGTGGNGARNNSNALHGRLGISGGVSGDSIYSTSTFAILEADLNVVAHSETLLSPVKAVFSIWGSLCVLTLDGKVRRYRERTLGQRLDMLYRRNLYHMAIELARKSGLDERQQNGIYRRFGEYLYQKGQYDEAMVQYIKAIDSTEPSQVIRKFLDTQRIHNLIAYLEELHEHHQANADHTTLLLNCYAKLKDVDKLEAFIKAAPGDDLRFDVDTAIAMCRQGGYYDQAVYLAKQHSEEDLVVAILVEDAQQYDAALAFIRRQKPEIAYTALMKYARVLLEHCPKDTTQLFIEYYGGKYRPRAEEGEIVPITTASTKEVSYKVPRPRTVFSSFIDQPDEFIVFLEACLRGKETGMGLETDDNDADRADRVDLSTALFEMYLLKMAGNCQIGKSEREDENKSENEGYTREAWEAKAKALIRAAGGDEAAPIEQANVLLLSHLWGFRTGTTLVKEQAGLLFDIFRSYTAAKDTRGALQALHQYGPEEPQLYTAALRYLTSSTRVLNEAGPAELEAVLRRIDDDGLMAPLQVVQMLNTNTVATMGMLKPYLQATIERERRETAANTRRIAALRAETQQRRVELADLGVRPAVFQATRCSQCALPLELPVVHFLCKHSFHQRCLKGDSNNSTSNSNSRNLGIDRGLEDLPGTECPLCAHDNATVRAIRRQQEEYAERHDLFKAELTNSEDRFSTVADWFQRGVMGVGGL